MKKKLKVRGRIDLHLKKLLLIMRLMAFLIMVLTIHVSASVYSQQTKLSLNFNDVTIREVLKQIEEQSSFKFLLQDERLNIDRKVNIHVNGETVENILDEIFGRQGINYIVTEKNLIIINPPSTSAISVASQQSKIAVSGTITDMSGQALPGVTVVVKGTTNGTITDADGRFELSNVPADGILVFSFVGMKAQEIPVGGKFSFSVKMQEETIGVDEVVVTALGMEREKKALGYSVGEVNSDMLDKVPQQNLLGSLYAKVSGLKISNSTNDINAQSYVTIRGLTSLVGNDSPLVVVDGVPNSNEQILKDLNAEDIESVSVLKGPSAAALYGSRAGNGVILITSKSGKMGQKGIGVSVNVGTTYSVPYSYVDLQNRFTTGQAGVFNESKYQSWYGPEEGVNAVQWNTNGESKPLVFYNNSLKDYFQTGVSTTADISVNGSFNRGTYRFSASYLGGDGVFPGVELKRNGVSMSVDYEITKKLKITTNMNISNPYSNNYHERDGDKNGYTSVYQIPPHVNINDLKDYWEVEDVQQRTVNTNYDNPWFAAYELKNKFNRMREIGSVKLDYQILPDLKLMGRYSFNGSNEKNSYRQPWSGYSGDGGGSNTPYGYYSETITNQREVDADFLLSWKKQIGKFDIQPSVGGNLMRQRNYDITAGGNKLVIPGLYTLSNVENTSLTYSSGSYKKNIYSVYALANLSYGNMVYLDLTARNDWSSTLPKANRSYFYPSASLSFLVNEMVELPSWFSLLKLRSGWAQVGKDTDPYKTMAALSQDTWGSQFTYSIPSNLNNVNLKPEIATSFEIGTDISFFTNRIGMGLTYYQVDNKNQILDASTSAWSGYTAAEINAGLVQNKGLEIELNAVPVKTPDFTWDMNLNFTRERSKLKELTKGIDQYQFWQSTQVYCITKVGDYIGDIYARDCVRVQDGDYKGWALLDSNGKMQRNDSEYKKVGNFTNDFMMGLQTTLRYKNVSLSMSFDWRQGGIYYDQTMMRLTRAGKVEKFHQNANSSTFTGLLSNNTFDGDNDALVSEIKGNPEKYQKNIWVGGRTEELGGFLYNGYYDGSFYPGVISDGKGGYKENFGASGTKYIHAYDVFATSGGYWDRACSDKWFYDGSFIKLREIVLSYTLPKRIAGKILAQDVTVSAFMKNILLWSAAKTNMDPESQYKQYADGTLWKGASTWNGSPIIMPAGFKLSVNF